MVKEEGLVIFRVAGRMSSSIEVFRSPVVRYLCEDMRMPIAWHVKARSDDTSSILKT